VDADDIVQQIALALREKFTLATDPAVHAVGVRFALNKPRQWIERRRS
jgi:hypothetical protein